MSSFIFLIFIIYCIYTLTLISLGVCIRLFQLLPGSFIAVFYTGLALALIITGCRFLFRWWCCRKRME